MKKLLLPFAITALVFWLGWAYVFIKIPPQDIVAYLLFLISLFLAFLPTLTLIFFIPVYFIKKTQTPRVLLRTCMRLSFFVSLCFSGLVLLQLTRLLNVLNACLLILAIALLAISLKKPR